MDLFLHKVAVIAFFGSHRVPGNGADLCFNGSAFNGRKGDALPGNHGHLLRFQEYQAACVFHDGRNI
ncbi:hypothetical protein SDC9_150429 [bioreactor metagenome]|uniref:Uncharacterized protein n=1 Tax=bioreactor metagenome TaxID=1076179 RepID=A0A645ERP7_9ZZZZ